VPSMLPARTDAFRAVRVLAARAVEALFVVLSLASLVFFAMRILPGDPAQLVLGDEASDAQLARVREALHLDAPIGTQYVRFLRGLCVLDLGDSFRRPGTSAMGRVLDALGPTSELAAVAVAIGSLGGIGVAVLASGPWLVPRARAWLRSSLVVVAAAPLVAFAPVVTWALAARVHLVPLPGDPDSGVSGLLYASTLLALPLGAHVGRVARASLADVERAPFLAVAMAKGAANSGGAHRHRDRHAARGAPRRRGRARAHVRAPGARHAHSGGLLHP
jgi:peptide/nickel transport system permease protein